MLKKRFPVARVLAVMALALSMLPIGTVSAAQTTELPNPIRYQVTPRSPHRSAPRTTAPVAPAAPVPAALSSADWRAVGPAPLSNGQRPGNGPVSGRIVGIAADKDDEKVIYLAAAQGGVWKTTDGGKSWTALTDKEETLAMGAIAIAPSVTDPGANIVYAGTGEANNCGDCQFGRGILKSTDGGATWTLQKGPGDAFDKLTIAQIVIDPKDAKVAYAAIGGKSRAAFLGGNAGIWKTTDGGTTWTNTTTAVNKTYPWSSVQIDPTNSNTVYGALGFSGGLKENGVYKSTDGGATWTAMPLTGAPSGTPAGRIVIAVSPSSPKVLYVSASAPSDDSLYKLVRSDDAGATFTDLTTGTPNYLGSQGFYDTTLIVDPTDSKIVYASGSLGPDGPCAGSIGFGCNSIIRSTDRGATWTDISGTTQDIDAPHVDHHAAAFDASGKYLDGDDGGIYRLEDPTKVTWSQLNGNLNTVQFQGATLHPTNAELALGGSQDNGTETFGTSGWKEQEGGDGGFVKYGVSKTNPNRVYDQHPVSSFGATGFFERSDDGGATWVGKGSGITDNTSSLQNFYSPFVVDSSAENTVLYGARHLWETTDGGDTWAALGDPFTANIDAISIHPANPKKIFVSAGGHLYFTSDRGVNWQARDLPAGAVGKTVKDIQGDLKNDKVQYAVVNQFTKGAGNIFKTTDEGLTWTKINGNLGDLPVWSLQIDPTAPTTKLYIGRDDGVFHTTDDGKTWVRFGKELPKVQVYEIQLNTKTKILGAATHGRGLWEISLP